MIYTTLNRIHAFNPSRHAWTKLLSYLGKTTADDEPLRLVTVLDSNGLEDTIWCLRICPDLAAEFAWWCADRTADRTADRAAHCATRADRAAAWAAKAAHCATRADEADEADEAANWADDAAYWASWAADWAADTADTTARATERKAQADKLRELLS